MDLFSIQSMINDLYAAVPCPSSCPPNASSSSSSPHFLHHHPHPHQQSPGCLSPFELHLNQMPMPTSSPSSDSSNAFPPPPSSIDLRRLDPELLQSVAHQLVTFAHPSVPSAAVPSSPLNALLLLLLQHFRALSNGQNSVGPFPSSVCPSSVLPLCATPDFRPLFPADWKAKNANPLKCFTTTCSLANKHQQQTPPATLSDFATASSSGSSCGGSIGGSSPGTASSKALSAADGVRNPCGGGGTAHRLSYPREFKLLVLKSFWANGQNKYRTCKEFQITKSMLNGWLQKADRIKRSRPGSLKSGRSGRRPQFPKVEQQLFEMVQHHLSLGECVSNKWIRKMAKKLTRGAEKEEREKDNGEEERRECQLSERWLNNFKRRFGIQTTAAEGTVTAGGAGEDGEAEEGEEAEGDETSNFGEASPTDEPWQNDEQWRSTASEICARSDRLPVQAFCDRFPKILQQPSGGGKRERNGAKNGL